MTKVIFILSFVLLTFSLTKPAKGDIKKEDEAKNEENSQKMMPVMAMEGQDKGQDQNADYIDLMQVMGECNETFRIEMSYLEALNESGSFPDESDRTAKCYIRCVLENTGVASEEGRFDPARTVVLVAAERGGNPLEGVEETATVCSDREESCKCERSYQYIKCIKEFFLMKYEKSQF